MNTVVYTETEACKLLKLCRRTLLELRKAGKLGYKRVGSKILYSQKHIDDFLADDSRKPILKLKAS